MLLGGYRVSSTPISVHREAVVPACLSSAGTRSKDGVVGTVLPLTPCSLWINGCGRFWWVVCRKYFLTASVVCNEQEHPALRGDQYLCSCK